MGADIDNKNIKVRVDMDCDSNLLLSNVTILPNSNIGEGTGLCGGEERLGKN